ncbi:4-(cytidine 5'-diphospho)-2-C-methyl-D-erythritol kinase [Paremcibacter congregatus]|uniref:4-(cytidine 5'-diphospho)-2-C-methyl-D-erythritol kinase n=1 Tax=Paremcibacter congregatus TaxID=2043170 RepID=UPI003A8CC1CF
MANKSVSRIARAKINLDLVITGQRADGYHLLDSLVVFADFGDQITVSPAEKLSLTISGPFGGGLLGQSDNLVLRSAQLLRDRFDIRVGAQIELIKNLPISSGIGGGSADAAAALKALAELWGLCDKIPEMGDLPLLLGADVPVCMASETRRMSGIGEVLTPVSLKKNLYMLLVNPGVSVSTAAIFQARAKRQAPFSKPLDIPPEIDDLAQLRRLLLARGNDLQREACLVEPVISEVLNHLCATEGCIYSAMSGSGATCFAIYETQEAARAAEGEISQGKQSWWVQVTQVI